MVFHVRDYDLAATLDSGQVFRWQKQNDSWIGVVGKYCAQLTQTPDGIRAETATPVKDWHWLRDFLQTEVVWAAILETFPDDAPMRAAVAACHGLRVLRQDPWECLASFILSSTKQIVQIRQIISLLCERFGEPVAPGAPASLPAASVFCAKTRRQAAGAPGNVRCGVESAARLDSAIGRTLQFSFPTPARIAEQIAA